jgi:hypothetical protein
MFGAIADLVTKGMEAWTADDERDHARTMAKIENRDIWTRRLSAAVMFAPLVVAYVSPETGQQMVATLDGFPKWYTGAVGGILSAIWMKAEVGSALRERGRRKGQE